jgi:hypothetical protein
MRRSRKTNTLSHIPHIRHGATQPKTAITASYQNFADSIIPLVCSPNPAIFCISTSAADSLRSPGAAARKASAEQKRRAAPWALFKSGTRKSKLGCTNVYSSVSSPTRDKCLSSRLKWSAAPTMSATAHRPHESLHEHKQDHSCFYEA